MIKEIRESIFKDKQIGLTHKQKLAMEFDEYLCDNYRRNVIMFRDSIDAGQIRDQIYVLYQLIGGRRHFYNFDKINDDGFYDNKYEYLAEVIKSKLDIEIRRKPGERINIKEYTKDHII